MFLEEKPHLLRLPLEPFRYYQYGERVVHLDGCVEVEAGRAPFALDHVRILYSSACGRRNSRTEFFSKWGNSPVRLQRPADHH